MASQRRSSASPAVRLFCMTFSGLFTELIIVISVSRNFLRVHDTMKGLAALSVLKGILRRQHISRSIMDAHQLLTDSIDIFKVCLPQESSQME
jgi:hypothetical protein